MRFDPDYRPFVAPRCIYVVPLSGDPSSYQVLIPARLSKDLPDLLIQDQLSIHRFKDCPAEAISNIKSQLRRICARGPSNYSIRMNRVLVAGTVLVVLGLINVTFPDPLPLADELLMIGGGCALGITGYRNRRKILPLLSRKTERAAERLDALESFEDILLTRIHEAIRARDAGGRERGKHVAAESADPFERESRWLVEYLDLQQLIDSETVGLEQLNALLEVLTNSFPLARFLSLEWDLRKNPKNGRARAARQKLAGRHGLSADAFTVFAEFYRLGREIVSSGGV
jgi:hypothetical protein